MLGSQVAVVTVCLPKAGLGTTRLFGPLEQERELDEEKGTRGQQLAALKRLHRHGPKAREDVPR